VPVDAKGDSEKGTMPRTSKNRLYKKLQQECMSRKAECTHLRCNEPLESLQIALRNCDFLKKDGIPKDGTPKDEIPKDGIPKHVILRSELPPSTQASRCLTTHTFTPNVALAVNPQPSYNVALPFSNDMYYRPRTLNTYVDRVPQSNAFAAQPVLAQLNSDRNQEIPPATVLVRGNNHNVNSSTVLQAFSPTSPNVNVFMYGEWKLADMRRQLHNNHLKAPFPALLEGYEQFLGGNPVGISVRRANTPSQMSLVQGSLFVLSRAEFERLQRRLTSYATEVSDVLVRDYSLRNATQRKQAVVFTRKDAPVLTRWSKASYIGNINEARKEVWGNNAWEIGVDTDGTVITGLHATTF
jgi:CRISPR/Cas system-associated endoribonuclease Cas2